MRFESIFSRTRSSVTMPIDRHVGVEQRDRSVLHLAGGIALGVDVRDLFELERALERGREVDVASEEEHAVRLAQLARDLANLVGRVEHHVDGRGQQLRAVGDLAQAPFVDRPAQAARGTARRASSRSTCETYVFVAATPISGPPRVNSIPSARRVRCEPSTLQIAQNARSPSASRCAPLRSCRPSRPTATSRSRAWSDRSPDRRTETRWRAPSRPASRTSERKQVHADQAGVIRGAAAR